jgi:hypothetical protein
MNAENDEPCLEALLETHGARKDPAGFRGTATEEITPTDLKSHNLREIDIPP